MDRRAAVCMNVVVVDGWLGVKELGEYLYGGARDGEMEPTTRR